MYVPPYGYRPPSFYQPPSYYQPPDYSLLEKRELRSRANQIGLAAIGFLAFSTILPLICTMLLRIFGYPFNGSMEFSYLTPTMYFLMIGVVYCLSLFLPFFVLMKGARVPPAEVLPFHKAKFGICAGCVFLGVAVCMLSNIPANWISAILQEIGFSGEAPSYPQADTLAGNLIYFIIIAVVPPLFEEFVFRGVVLGRLRRFGDGFAILASALLFGLFHGNFIQIPFAFLVGLVLGFVVVRTNNLWVAIAIHFINNAFAVSMEFLSRYAENIYLTANNLFFLCMCVLGLLSAILLSVRYKNFFRLKAPNSTMSAGERFGAFLSSPGVLVFACFCVLEAVFMLWLF